MRTLFAVLIGLTSLAAVFPASTQAATPAAAPASVARTLLRDLLPHSADGLPADLNVVAETSGLCLYPSLTWQTARPRPI